MCRLSRADIPTMNIQKYLDQKVELRLAELGAADAPAVVRQAGKPEFGHYQANGVMGAAKKQKTNPRALAQQVAEGLTDLSDKADLDIAGPGFINITLHTRFIGQSLTAMVSDDRLGVASAAARRIVVDSRHPISQKKCILAT